MIFILGLIPVAGVIISLVPLTIIAFNIGGAIKIIEVIVMIVVLHSLETYVLNPKLMSAKTKIPVFLVFLILLVSEHYIGVWGLLFGIPLFMFLLDILDIKVKDKS
jgi:predicted PurR-regulated permease PerM